MKPKFLICFGTRPLTWKDILSESQSAVMEILDECAKYGVFPDEDALRMEYIEEEERFWESTAAALGMDSSTFQQLAAVGRITWREEDRPVLKPRIQCRLDGGHWSLLLA
jgi:hypothetical protein